MKLAVIVLNYNDYETTKDFVSHIYGFSAIDKIVVVDNASTDESSEKLKELQREKIDVIFTNENKGYACGNNEGIFYAIKMYNPEYLLISNPDIIFEEDVVEDMIRFQEQSDKNIGLVSGRMLDSKGQITKGSWKIRTIKDCILGNIVIPKKVKRRDDYALQHFEGKVSQVDVIAGAFFLVKTQVMKNIDFFDPRTFLYWEEDILAYKLKDKGYENYILNEKTFIHNHSVSINKSIKSVQKRLELAEESKKHYMKEYLKAGRFMMFLDRVTFFIGKKMYVLFKH